MICMIIHNNQEKHHQKEKKGRKGSASEGCEQIIQMVCIMMYISCNNNIYIERSEKGRARGTKKKKTEAEKSELGMIFRYIISMLQFFNVLVIIIIITFKGAIQDFLQSPHSAANCLQHARLSGPGTIVCKSRATHRALIMCNMSC